MATFDAAQRADLIPILRINPDVLGNHLDIYAASISEAMKTKVVALIAEWQAGTVARNITRIKANDKNFGAEINPNELRGIIQGEIAELLFCTDLINGGSSNQATFYRG